MPLIHSSSDAAFKENVRNLMHEIGQSPHVKNRAQALAIAYATKRRGKQGGGNIAGLMPQMVPPQGGGVAGGVGGLRPGVMPMMPPQQGVMPPQQGAISPLAGMRPQMPSLQQRMARRPGGVRPPGMALGGVEPSLHTLPDYFTRRALSSERQFQPKIHMGPIMGGTMGRGDRVPMKVASGSYVLPADHISHLGQGNTMAGFNVVNRMFSSGPFGTALPKTGGRGVGMPKLADAGRITPGIPSRQHGYHPGAQGEEEGGEPVDIMAADGEYVLSPAQVRGKFGDLKKGHEALDEWIVHERKKHVAKLQKLPGPVKE